MNEVKRAIIMAAGLGTRLLPITKEVPKPLVKVNGIPIIETIIEGLHLQSINNIYIVVGHLAEQYDYLKEKYKGINLIFNPNYLEHNNISSLYVARNYIEDSIILDGDLIVKNYECLHKDFLRSGYNAIWTENHTSEWIMEVKNEIVVSCSRDGGDRGWQLFSISRWTQSDGQKLKKLIEKEYIDKGNNQIYWDDIAMFCYPECFELGIVKMNEGDVVEIDSIEDLVRVDSSYKNVERK